MVLNARCDLRREKVTARCLQELQDRPVLERGRIRHVDDNLSALEGFSQPLAGDGVDP